MSYQPQTVVLGATQFRHDDEPNRIVYETSNPLKPQNRRIKWNTAKPMYTVAHFKSAGTRAAHARGELTLEQATHEVPMYRGISRSLYKQLLSDRRYKAKLAHPKWLARCHR